MDIWTNAITVPALWPLARHNRPQNRRNIMNNEIFIL